MEVRTFGSVLKKAREVRSVSLNRLAKEMMQFGAGKGAAANLSSLQRGLDSPSEKKVMQIADALSSYAGDSGTEKDRLLSELMSAAGIGGVTDTSQQSYLRRKCEKRLGTSPDLKPHEVQTILDHIGIPTMKRIAEADESERISVNDLKDIATELNAKAGQDERDPEGMTYYSANSDHTDKPDHIIEAGRATILVKGNLSPNQNLLLRNIAGLICNLLR